jgi:aldehyde:ferredoxin oxidoreductase
MYGWMDNVLRVNLTDRTIKTEFLNKEKLEKYLGGRGLASKMLSDEIDPGIDALSPENKILFAVGPLTAVRGPLTARFMVVTKGPLTGAIACSNSGGTWGAEMRRAGYDVIVIEGKADEPVYLWINGSKVEICSAKNVWGKGVTQATEQLKAETNEKAKVSCIGPAGENLSLISAIINDYHRAAGRSGVGAVMGSKNLKAVVVKGAGKKVQVADPDALKEVAARCREKIKESTTTSMVLPKLGTAMCVVPVNSQGAYLVQNGRKSFIEDDSAINGEALAAKYVVKNSGCSHCMIQCGRETRVPDGLYACEGEGPEYESMWALGACCGILDRLDAVIKANQLCDELGLDTISMGLTISCAMDMFDDELIPVEDIGAPLKFGDAAMVVKLVEDTGYAKGFGAKLAQGSYRLAESYGYPGYSLSSKKQEIAAYDPRGAQGQGLAYATSNRGACHSRANVQMHELMGVNPTVNPHITEGKARLVKDKQDFWSTVDSAGICGFLFLGITNQEFVDALTAVTGIKWDMELVQKTGERIWNMEKLFNLRAGLTVKDDSLPPCFLKIKPENGPTKGMVNKLDEMLPEYYKLRGWNEEGVPTVGKLQELGL